MTQVVTQPPAMHAIFHHIMPGTRTSTSKPRFCVLRPSLHLTRIGALRRGFLFLEHESEQVKRLQPLLCNTHTHTHTHTTCRWNVSPSKNNYMKCILSYHCSLSHEQMHRHVTTVRIPQPLLINSDDCFLRSFGRACEARETGLRLKRQIIISSRVTCISNTRTCVRIM